MAVLQHLLRVVAKVEHLMAQPLLFQDLFQFIQIGLRAPSQDPYDIASWKQQRLAAGDKSVEINFVNHRFAVRKSWRNIFLERNAELGWGGSKVCPSQWPKPLGRRAQATGETGPTMGRCGAGVREDGGIDNLKKIIPSPS